MQIARQIQILAGLLAAAVWCATISCTDSCAKEKAGYQKLLPKLDTLPAPKEPAKKLKGGIRHSEILPAKDVGNPWGYLPFGAATPYAVSTVVPASPAFFSGLRTGDRILYAELSASKDQLVVERAGKKYSCIMTLSGQVEKSQPSADAQKLADHEIVLLIDSSASMLTKDCPGGSSRWDWCKSQATDLFNEGKELFKNKVSVTTFNSQMRSFANCKIDSLEQVFAQTLPEGETIMAPAIDDAMSTLRSQIYAGRPAVISVITDGRPTDVEPLKKKITQIANDLRDPSLLTIAFIEIGTPERYLKELDNDLVKQGAKEDIVTVFPFSAVAGQGLAKTLAQAVTSHAQASKPAAPPSPAPRVVASPAVETDAENPPAPPPPPPKPKPSPEQIEKARLEKEKRDAEESKVRRSAANSTYNFSKSGTHQAPAPPPQKKPESKVVEVDEKESVRRQQSNRTYGTGQRH
jgi:uncharacterized protein YegL